MFNKTLYIIGKAREIIVLDGRIDEAINSSQLYKISKKICYGTWQKVSKINVRKKD